MSFSKEVKSAVEKYAIREHVDFGKIYAYEVDGFGNALFMDDANVPSLMSLAYIGGHTPSKRSSFIKTQGQFLIKRFSNPWFLKRCSSRGTSPAHTQGGKTFGQWELYYGVLTSEDENEISKCLFTDVKGNPCRHRIYARVISQR
jgi:meiotically up-regulated gene 157 (Mug157) protein